MLSIKLLFWAITLIDITVAIVIFISALNTRMLLIPLWYRLGLLVAAFGFAAQSGLNLPYLLLDKNIMAQTLPFWILKDMGVGLVAIYYFWSVMISRKNAAPLPKPKKAITPARKKSPPRSPRKKTTP
ncbi:hypothetical protein [Cronobacter dublinensis]|uniref:Inner membrane protein n=1 Tax=Cronobacter dublinensis 1210 TaxID=1208656 RepID=A0ABM9Q7X2_9ENTR|nr:hypothetical protein [Cronobacter dublinensis]EGT5711971.1 hypothetical protein [Cronobacter dublinensis subsp. dublinensis]CCJ81615.1 FIG00554447: hypothetical protein [Cronobacter dublinensis 1210]ALB65442.1 hypothetical protein AFK67_02725 [Cronobacter dublinensis subsp. dublinensis LMG 23823]EGT4380896.1 hypothetical protein [Cronobacter dublinensis]EKM6459400.1 hypothetical protein [Cronobacter dublinensis]